MTINYTSIFRNYPVYVTEGKEMITNNTAFDIIFIVILAMIGSFLGSMIAFILVRKIIHPYIVILPIEKRKR